VDDAALVRARERARERDAEGLVVAVDRAIAAACAADAVGRRQ